MKKSIKMKTHALVDETVKKIQEIVQIDSVRNEDEQNNANPYGFGIGKSLDKFLEMASEIGMRTYRDPEGYYGYAEIGDENAKEMLGILGHLDVVPVGDLAQWTLAAPFSGDIVDEMIVGRGTQDDKGPMIVNLMAIKSLIDLKFQFKKRVRLIVGTAEETTWEGIGKYFAKEEAPTFGYTPDASFPVINGEKSLVQYVISEENTNFNFEVSAPGAFNAVSDLAKYKGPNLKKIAEVLEKKNVRTELEGKTLSVFGKGAHASLPKLGDNAIGNLVQAIAEVDSSSQLINFLNEYVGKTTNGEKIFGKVEDDVSGELTLNLGWLEINENTSQVGIDMRIPVLINENEILKIMEDKVKSANLIPELKELKEKIYVPADTTYIRSMINNYREVSGDSEAQPIAIGGGTYARSGDNIVAFGMSFTNLGQEEYYHQANERLEIKYIPLALEIYANTIAELTNDEDSTNI